VKIEVLISTKGKIQVAWQDEAEKQRFLPILEGFLVTEDREKVELIPQYCNVVNVPYPPPSKFSFAWCQEKFQYFRNLGFFMWWEQRAQRKVVERKMKRREYLAQAKFIADHAYKEWGVPLPDIINSVEKNLKDQDLI
jgi:hypothetical protein